MSGLRTLRTQVGGRQIKILLIQLWQEDSGQDLAEYALLVVLIALAAVASMKALATSLKNVFSSAAANMTTNT
ncbi:MAG: hypothetical protein WBP79_11265 [Candidatus Acidiferrales bacterium]